MIHRLFLLLLAATPTAVPAAAADRHGAADAVAGALRRARTQQPRLHATDFALDHIGCIVLPRREMRSFGYRGHAVACEEASHGQVLGAVLDKRGNRICDIVGQYADDDCYELTFCDVPERLCVH